MEHWRYPPSADDGKEHKGSKSNEDWIHKVAELFKLQTLFKLFLEVIQSYSLFFGSYSDFFTSPKIYSGRVIPLKFLFEVTKVETGKIFSIVYPFDFCTAEMFRGPMKTSD